ncbi:hypothetical protein F5B19DRAFT_146377 [Rostrohypoxylon terebratum]|nr:hypothetical protein F5B19DRAFT_146377 [Rostrohypoxylon terebratum]
MHGFIKTASTVPGLYISPRLPFFPFILLLLQLQAISFSIFNMLPTYQLVTIQHTLNLPTSRLVFQPYLTGDDAVWQCLKLSSHSPSFEWSISHSPHTNTGRLFYEFKMTRRLAGVIYLKMKISLRRSKFQTLIWRLFHRATHLPGS